MHGLVSFNIFIKGDDTHAGGVLISTPKSSVWEVERGRWCIDKLGSFMHTKHLCVLIHIWTKGDVGAPWNWFGPSCKIFHWPFQSGTSFADHLCYFCLVFVRVCLLMPCGHLLGKGWPLGSRLWCLIVKLSISHWYPGSGVLLDCIDSLYLPSFLLLFQNVISYKLWQNANFEHGVLTFKGASCK